MTPTNVALSIHHLSIAYSGADHVRLALQDVSLVMNKGSWISIVGANGSGKSTLAKFIAGLVPPNEGHMVKAEDVRIHIVLQNPETQILGDTIYEEINLSFRDSDTSIDHKAAIRAILDEVGLDLPLDAVISSLSGGQQQLLNIAACVAAGANFFILDEVTSMLDYASRDQVIQVIRMLNHRGATIVWLTHRSEELGYAERVIMLEDGRVSYDGTTSQFLYGESNEDVSPCEQSGMQLPYVVQVVQQLEKRGYSLHERPLLPQELSEAIKARCL